jgi:hypothetical protein
LWEKVAKMHKHLSRLRGSPLTLTLSHEGRGE